MGILRINTYFPLPHPESIVASITRDISFLMASFIPLNRHGGSRLWMSAIRIPILNWDNMVWLMEISQHQSDHKLNQLICHCAVAVSFLCRCIMLIYNAGSEGYLCNAGSLVHLFNGDSSASGFRASWILFDNFCPIWVSRNLRWHQSSKPMCQWSSKVTESQWNISRVFHTDLYWEQTDKQTTYITFTNMY